MMIALIFGAAGERSARPETRSLALAVACSVPVIGLVLAEPDLGVVVVLVVISGGMIALSGVGLRWLALLAGAGALGLLAVLKLHLLKAYQVGRLTSFLHPSADPTGHRVAGLPGQDRDRLRAACSARDCSTASSPPAASSGPTASRGPTSSSPWRARNSASSGAPRSSCCWAW